MEKKKEKRRKWRQPEEDRKGNGKARQEGQGIKEWKQGGAFVKERMKE